MSVRHGIDKPPGIAHDPCVGRRVRQPARPKARPTRVPLKFGERQRADYIDHVAGAHHVSRLAFDERDWTTSSCRPPADLPRLRSREDLVQRILEDQEAMRELRGVSVQVVEPRRKDGATSGFNDLDRCTEGSVHETPEALPNDRRPHQAPREPCIRPVSKQPRPLAVFRRTSRNTRGGVDARLLLQAAPSELEEEKIPNPDHPAAVARDPRALAFVDERLRLSDRVAWIGSVAVPPAVWVVVNDEHMVALARHQSASRRSSRGSRMVMLQDPPVLTKAIRGSLATLSKGNSRVAPTSIRARALDSGEEYAASETARMENGRGLASL